MFFTNKQLDKHIRRRPSVQDICLGAFLQQPTFVTAEVLAVPLSEVGIEGTIKLVCDYISADLEITITIKEVKELIEVGKHANPGVVLIWHPEHDSTTDDLISSASRPLERAQRTLSLITGDKFDVVANIVLHDKHQKYENFPPKSKNRQRLWFSREEAKNFQENIVRLSSLAELDSRVSLALQLYLDAINDKSEEFKIVKFYNVLECLASNHKKDGVGSRDAIRKMLNLQPGKFCSVEYKEKQIQFDLISVAGIIRDKIMHGAKIKKEAFAKNDRDVFEILAYEPFKLVYELQSTVDEYFFKIASYDKQKLVFHGWK